MEREPGQHLGIASLPNLRDVGGYSTRDGGRVRTGLLYRSSELSRLDGADAAAFARLRIRAVYDLRTEGERTAQPDRLPPGTEHVVVDVIRDSADATPASRSRAASSRYSPGRALTVLPSIRKAIFFPAVFMSICSGNSLSCSTHVNSRPKVCDYSSCSCKSLICLFVTYRQTEGLRLRQVKDLQLQAS